MTEGKQDIVERHTPGPWRYGRATNYDGFYIAPDISLPTLAAVQTDGRVTAFNFPGQTEANARLIAAAPSLLEALEKIAANRPDGHAKAGTTCRAIARTAIRLAKVKP
jgi:hypothetical protein